MCNTNKLNNSNSEPACFFCGSNPGGDPLHDYYATASKSKSVLFGWRITSICDVFPRCRQCCELHKAVKPVGYLSVIFVAIALFMSAPWIRAAYDIICETLSFSNWLLGPWVFFVIVFSVKTLFDGPFIVCDAAILVFLKLFHPGVKPEQKADEALQRVYDSH